MPKDELPSLDDFTENPVELPSVDEFITEEKVVEELPSVDEYVVDIEEKVIYEKQNLPSIEEKIVDESLPTIEDYVEEEEVVVEEILKLRVVFLFRNIVLICSLEIMNLLI